MIENTMLLNQTDCLYHEEEVNVLKKENKMYQRLVACPVSKSQDWKPDYVIRGVVNNDLKKDFHLETVCLKCTVNHTSSSSHQFELYTVLEVGFNATATWAPFDQVDVMVICLHNNSQKMRFVTSYNIVYDTRGKFHYYNVTVVLRQISRCNLTFFNFAS